MSMHGATIAVAADNDVAHGQGIHGEIDRGGSASGARMAIGRYKVAYVSNHKQIAGIGRSEDVHGHSAVRAGDEERVRFLSKRQFGERGCKALALGLAKLNHATNEFFHCKGG